MQLAVQWSVIRGVPHYTTSPVSFLEHTVRSSASFPQHVSGPHAKPDGKSRVVYGPFPKTNLGSPDQRGDGY